MRHIKECVKNKKNIDIKKGTNPKDSQSCTVNTSSEGKVFYGKATTFFEGRKALEDV